MLWQFKLHYLGNTNLTHQSNSLTSRLYAVDERYHIPKGGPRLREI